MQDDEEDYDDDDDDDDGEGNDDDHKDMLHDDTPWYQHIYLHSIYIYKYIQVQWHKQSLKLTNFHYTN